MCKIIHLAEVMIPESKLNPVESLPELLWSNGWMEIGSFEVTFADFLGVN